MNNDISVAQSVLNDAFGIDGQALLTTADKYGVPHSTWVGSIAVNDEGKIITLTSPKSQKVANVRENPAVEWLFTSKDFSSLVYFNGFSDVIDEPTELKTCWNLVKEKDKAYFLNRVNPGPGFAFIKTHVDSISLVQPKEGYSHNFDVSEFWETSRDLYPAYKNNHHPTS